jgi:O-antigen/teichoic acid export membrane protein
MKWLRAAALPFRTTELDLSTPHGRAGERLRRIGLTSATSVVARSIGFATGFIIVPLALHYLGRERFGMWATLSSVFALSAVADFGVSNGLLNAIAVSHGRDDRAAAARQASTAFVTLTAVALALAVIFILAYASVSWADLFNVSSPVARSEAGLATAALVGCVLVNVPVGITGRIRQGYQEGYKTSAYDAAGNVLGLAFVLLAIYRRASLPWLVLAMAGGPVIANMVHAAVLFGRDRPWLRVRLGEFDGGTARMLARHGLMFFALQVAAVLMFVPDNFIIAHRIGPEAVAEYSVAFKLFSVSLLVAEVALVPLWPAYGEAIARGDHAWVRDMVRRSLTMTALMATLVAGLLVLLGNSVIALWVGPEMSVGRSLLLGLGVWTIVGAVSTAGAMYLNAAHRVGVQVACAAAMIPVSLGLKVVLVGSLGTAGAPWGLVLAYLALVATPLVILGLRGRLAPP